MRYVGPMIRFNCPVLGSDVELTDERARHIAERHPDLLPAHLAELGAAVREPNDVLPAFVGDKRLFVRWADTIKGGRYVVAVVVSEGTRHWIVTAYLTRRPPTGG